MLKCVDLHLELLEHPYKHKSTEEIMKKVKDEMSKKQKDRHVPPSEEENKKEAKNASMAAMLLGIQEEFSQPVFWPGDTVKGIVVIKVKEPILAQYIMLELIGESVVVHGLTEKRISFIKEHVTLWENSEKEMHPGKYNLPFQFKIPESSPQSLKVSIKDDSEQGTSAGICYYLYTSVQRCKIQQDGDVFMKYSLWVDRPVDISLKPEMFFPLTKTEEKTAGALFWKSGLVTCSISLPKKAYVRGDEVVFTIGIDNKSGKVVNYAKPFLRMKVQTRTNIEDKWYSAPRVDYVQASADKVGPVQPGENQSHEVKVWVSLPRGMKCHNDNLPLSMSPDSCPIINVGYEVGAEVDIAGTFGPLMCTESVFVGSHDSSQGVKLRKPFVRMPQMFRWQSINVDGSTNFEKMHLMAFDFMSEGSDKPKEEGSDKPKEENSDKLKDEDSDKPKEECSDKPNEEGSDTPKEDEI